MNYPFGTSSTLRTVGRVNYPISSIIERPHTRTGYSLPYRFPMYISKLDGRTSLTTNCRMPSVEPHRGLTIHWKGGKFLRLLLTLALMIYVVRLWSLQPSKQDYKCCWFSPAITLQGMSTFISQSKVKTAFLASFIHEDISKQKLLLEELRILDYVVYGGAPLPKSAGDIIYTKTELSKCDWFYRVSCLARSASEEGWLDVCKTSTLRGYRVLRLYWQAIWGNDYPNPLVSSCINPFSMDIQHCRSTIPVTCSRNTLLSRDSGLMQVE